MLVESEEWRGESEGQYAAMAFEEGATEQIMRK
jgi:hypothetical protein